MEVTAFCERAIAIVQEDYQGLVKTKQLLCEKAKIETIDIAKQWQ